MTQSSRLTVAFSGQLATKFLSPLKGCMNSCRGGISHLVPLKDRQRRSRSAPLEVTRSRKALKVSSN
ncbi:hypothetical protein J2W27_004537 [Variovorax boronicumulans]|nr:hypothetical protein [Variovorax boronicumulans]